MTSLPIPTPVCIPLRLHPFVREYVAYDAAATYMETGLRAK